MKSTEHGISESKAVENMCHMRIMALLQELVRKRGPRGAARVLEIDPKTVGESIRTGQLSRRTRDALERALQEDMGSAAERQRERDEKLEARVDAVEQGQDDLGKELRRRLASVKGGLASLRRDGPDGTGAGHAGPGPSPRTQPVRRTSRRAGTRILRRGSRCARSTPTLRRWSLPKTTRRYPARPGPSSSGGGSCWRPIRTGRGRRVADHPEARLEGRTGRPRRPRDDPAA